MTEKCSNLPKCNNACYCKYSKDNIHCNGSEEIIDNCLYLKAIEYIALLSIDKEQETSNNG